MTPNKLNVLDVPSCYSTNDENENTAKVYFYLTCALYWNDRIWDITCSSCAVGAHSIAVIQSVFWWFIHVFASVRCSLITRTINLHDLFIKNRLYSSTCISYYGIIFSSIILQYKQSILKQSTSTVIKMR